LGGLFATIVCCLQHVEIETKFVSARKRTKCPIFGFFAKFGGRRRRNEKRHQSNCFSAERQLNCSFERIIYYDSLLLTRCRIIDELRIGTSPCKMFDFWIFRQVRRSTSSIRKGILASLFLRWKNIETVLLSGYFTTIVCCSQHVEVWTKSVSTRHRAKCLIFRLFAKFGGRRRRNEKCINQIVFKLKNIRTVFASKSFNTIVCYLQHVEILTNFVSARHRAKCLIVGLFVKFGGRRRRTEEAYWPDCFSANRYQNCYF